MISVLAASDPLSHVVQHTLWAINGDGGFWSFPILSNHILMQVISAALLIWLMPGLVRRTAGADSMGRLVPSGPATLIELVCVWLREKIFRPNLQQYTDIFAPYLWSTFFFILTCNVLGLIPIVDLIGWTPLGTLHLLGGTSTGNLWVTAALAIVTLCMMVYNGLRYHGMGYISHFFMGPWYMAWFIAILEILGLGFKTMALSVRLFANMVAGHVLLAALLGFVASAGGLFSFSGFLIAIPVILASVAIYFLEIFVALLHAFIFTTLTAVFIGLSINIHHDEHEHEHEHAHAADHAGERAHGGAPALAGAHH